MAEPSPTKKRLFTAREAAAYLSIGTRTLWRMTNSGQVRAVRFGAGHRKSVRYDVSDLHAWIEARKGARR